MYSWRRLQTTASESLKRKLGLGGEAIVSLFIHGCFQFGASMSGLFLNLYLWRLTENLWINGMFNLIVYGVTPIAFAVGGYIAKRRDRMVTYRVGIVLIAVFYLVVVIARDSVVDYYPLFALCNGFALGLYWNGYLVLMYDVVDSRGRGRYLGINMVVFNTAGLIGPALAGFLIGWFEGLQGYIVMFSVACFMFMIAALFSTRIRKKPSHHRTYYLKYTLSVLKKEPVWLQGLFGFLLLGIFQGIMLFLPNILLYQTVGSERWVGLLTMFFAMLTISMGLYISRRSDRDSVRGSLALSTSLVTSAACLLLIDIDWWSVLLFMAIFSFFNPLTVNTLTSYNYRLMDFLPLRGEFRIESVVIKELFLNIGRVLSILFLILFADDPDSRAMPIVLVLAALLHMLIVPLVRKKGQEISGRTIEREKA
ncbi:MFS transporter [Cohnella fermenti]|uniref:MFS transporter n=1 Tax=Cohnella fermenti TaxID=2565925 RepID=A0A4S4BTT6_9BACL|nr:MFS transporter [Cohnella fermenti]THF78339.1 MFS transporter [Cohnella fermenti]